MAKPKPNSRRKQPGKLVRKGKLKVYTGKIPDIDVEQAIAKTRQYPLP